MLGCKGLIKVVPCCKKKANFSDIIHEIWSFMELTPSFTIPVYFSFLFLFLVYYLFIFKLDEFTWYRIRSRNVWNNMYCIFFISLSGFLLFINILAWFVISKCLLLSGVVVRISISAHEAFDQWERGSIELNTLLPSSSNNKLQRVHWMSRKPHLWALSDVSKYSVISRRLLLLLGNGKRSVA